MSILFYICQPKLNKQVTDYDERDFYPVFPPLRLQFLCALEDNVLLMLMLPVLKILINCAFYCPYFFEASQAKHSALRTNEL